MTLTGAFGEHPFQPGTRWPLDGKSVSSQVLDTGRSVTSDPYHRMSGKIAEAARSAGLRGGVGAPVLVDGRVWGNVTVGGTEPAPLRADIERRLTQFTELIATAVSNAQARSDLRRLAEEQAALRRIATLVAQGADSQLVFDAVCEETGRLFAATTVNLVHFTPDGFHLATSGWSMRHIHVPTGTLLPLAGETIDTIVRRTAAPGRCDSYEGVAGELAELIRRQGIRSEVGAPVIVGGIVWGALIAGTDESEPLAAGTEDRLASFAELIATAVSNATTRSELLASRARIVGAADEQRRRVVRDLHDGAQQRLVNALITLQLRTVSATLPRSWHGSSMMRSSTPPQPSRSCENSRTASIQRCSPAAGSGRRSRRSPTAPISVRLDASDRRYPAVVESAAYFVAAEALTNVAKYASATAARVTVADGPESLALTIEDDGIGGASLADGKGLSGLLDRVPRFDGTLTVDSPPGEGTRVSAEIPIPPAGAVSRSAPPAPPAPPTPPRRA